MPASRTPPSAMLIGGPGLHEISSPISGLFPNIELGGQGRVCVCVGGLGSGGLLSQNESERLSIFIFIDHDNGSWKSIRFHLD